MILENGLELTKETLEENSFSTPILIKNKEGLEIKVPDESSSVEKVEDIIGKLLEFIIVSEQCNLSSININELVSYT